ncbi:rRNA maturation RNase YbeY [Marinilactibacillus psychrotolerans]|uniref:Endoribonuclease YbeY n=2 Tax=Marinilactibacillus psychrotolerans TaxID=191770 RepID=A0A511GYD0_9LACT|nr:rRNA maturation RNase YbeY [Marinilactibacillus psychrotolerans]TLQ08653.1 rRNA maturation RNase YbeY [Marinilactibacillus psychrotolerans]SDC24482.1 probable rRNA maturation factor [Marinilactibacillus psychrotolerans]SJN42192.1 Metal-dependent hydrolase YbeY, involved in rRNA and/or ribosome maturation and assembly [Marinilactibacillus psychrotolerans 42ea]GEL66270.1 endoribonuclease YbeY [Marinilactibacillus psychrotolerans]GEQ32582.1 16S rRNA maturation RNase YbeY [Marinilactibacillus p
MEIILYDETNQLKKSASQLIHDILEFAADRLSLEVDAEISVTIVDNNRIQEINKTYRNKDYATDVISFAMEDETEDDWLNSDEVEIDLPRVLGDLFISIDKTVEQAEEYGHSFERELGFLVVHGLLHLNGYDHMTETDEKEMFALQERILKEYGLER